MTTGKKIGNLTSEEYAELRNRNKASHEDDMKTLIAALDDYFNVPADPVATAEED